MHARVKIGKMDLMHDRLLHMRSSMKRLAVLGLVLFTASGCRPISLTFVDPPGPPEYQLGWQDGCDSGISAEGDWLHKAAYGFKKRPEMAANDQYKQGWNEGFTYCRFAMAKTSGGGDFGDVGW